MNRLIYTFMAAFSILAANIHPVRAQEGNSDFTSQPKQISGKTDGKKTGADTDVSPKIIHAGTTVDHVDVRNRELIIEGNVLHNVKAVNSHVTIRPGASIGGTMFVQGSLQCIGIREAAPSPAIAMVSAQPNTSPPSQKASNWFGGQFALWLLGMSALTILALVASKATNRTAESIRYEPGRCLITGAVVGIGLLAMLALSGKIMATHSFISLIWVPVLAVIAIGSILLMLSGWLAGMRLVGDILSKRLGWNSSGHLYWRSAFGLTAFFLLNITLGGIHPTLGAIGLLTEFALSLMGIGAIASTGFGSDQNWLGDRMKGSSNWFSGSRRI